MRTIKFRAWWRSGQQMLYQEKQGTEQFDAIGRWLRYSGDDYDLMQFTGLLDKNGKDVYEGDIVEGNPIGSTGVRRGQVIWMNDGWYVSDETERDQEKRLHEDFFTKVEVLGNFYENPELLK